MKTIGLIGGMSWESTAHYYAILNRETARLRGGLHSAPVIVHSVDFAPIEAMQRAGDWDGAGAQLAQIATTLEAQGCGVIGLATNTMHICAPQIVAALTVPFIHIAAPTADALLADGIGTVGLLGTRFTMEQAFYRGRLEERHGIAVLVPAADDRDRVHRVIYEELCLGRVEEASRAAYRAVMRRLVERGAQGIILGCTEISMLVSAQDANVPLFDTTAIHAAAAVELALGEGQEGGAVL